MILQRFMSEIHSNFETATAFSLLERRCRQQEALRRCVTPRQRSIVQPVTLLGSWLIYTKTSIGVLRSHYSRTQLGSCHNYLDLCETASPGYC